MIRWIGLATVFLAAVLCWFLGLAVLSFAQSATAPTITSPGPFTVAEGQTAVTTLTADDTDTAVGDLQWTEIGGADANAFALTTAGVLTFTGARDFENPDDNGGDGSYEVTVQVSDGAGQDTADLVVTLENVIELASTISGPTGASFPENSAFRVASYTASSDEDRAGVTWTITGADVDHFTMDSPPGVLRFHIDAGVPKHLPRARRISKTLTIPTLTTNTPSR